MPCDETVLPGQSFQARAAEVKAALKRLETLLQSGIVKVVIGANGAITFSGWTDRSRLTDVCAYRVLSMENSWALRQAVSRAEVTQGRKVNPRAIAAGVHSHDGGKTWGRH